MFFNSRWPSLLLTLAMLVFVGICLKRIDFLLIDEVKAVISIAFGFATSCLLKPMHGTSWPTVTNVSIVDAPNMHPRASMVSEMANEDRRCQQDQPPDYENALIHSKPISWIVAANRDGQKVRFEDQSSDSGPKRDAAPQGDHFHEDLRVETARRDPVTHGLHKISSSDNMTQLAFSIVKGFTSIPNSPPQQTMAPNDDQLPNGSHYNHDQRKISHCQLDVSQLINQGSPPKYCEITMPQTDRMLSNQSNEPKAGSSTCRCLDINER